MIKNFLYQACCVVLCLSACKSINYEAEKQEIQHIMNEVSATHFEKNATKFYNPNAENWWDVRGGTVQYRSKEESILRTQTYLNNMEFLELSPSHKPIIELSKDGSMASYIGAVHHFLGFFGLDAQRNQVLKT